MSSHKIARSGADGNSRLLAQYGGHSSGRKAYADGGAVNPSLDEGLAAAGDSGSGMKPMKGDKADKKSAKTNINIIVNGPPEKPAAPGPMAGPPPPMPPMPPPPPPAPPMGASGMGPPMGPPGGPPMGPGGPGLPMRAKGGRVERHSDAKADKGVVKAAVGKHEAAKHPGEPRTPLSTGGPAKAPRGFNAGAGGGEGRLEKIKKYGK